MSDDMTNKELLREIGKLFTKCEMKIQQVQDEVTKISRDLGGSKQDDLSSLKNDLRELKRDHDSMSQKVDRIKSDMVKKSDLKCK